MNTRITVLGAGSWGTALALHLARKGLDVCLWSGREEQARTLQETRVNTRYLPDILFPTNLTCTANLSEALQFSAVILIVVPSHVFRDVLEKCKAHFTPQHQLIWATKGIDPVSDQLLHEVVADVLGEVDVTAVLSGPNFAREIALGLPAATTLACTNPEHQERLVQLFKSATLRVYGSSDVIGVEIGGAVKNVIAIAVGICDGLLLGANARAALITRGLAEITRLGLAMKALPETFVSMAGMGDLLLTCTDNQSRNRRFGLMVGQGREITTIFTEIGQVVEGYHNVKQVLSLANRYHVSMPITEQVYNICYQQLDPAACALALMTR